MKKLTDRVHILNIDLLISNTRAIHKTNNQFTLITVYCFRVDPPSLLWRHMEPKNCVFCVNISQILVLSNNILVLFDTMSESESDQDLNVSNESYLISWPSTLWQRCDVSVEAHCRFIRIIRFSVLNCCTCTSAVEKNRDSIFTAVTTMWKLGLNSRRRVIVWRWISIRCKMLRDRLFAIAFFWNTNSQAEQISLAAVDCTHFKRKRSQKIDRATFCTGWKSAFMSLISKPGLDSASDIVEESRIVSGYCGDRTSVSSLLP